MPTIEANRKIVKLISNAVEQMPDMNFHQIMQSIGFEVPYHNHANETSFQTLDKYDSTAL